MKADRLKSTIIKLNDHLQLKDEVHIFCFNIDLCNHFDLQNFATAEELSKAASFRHIEDAQRFLAGRIITKKILSKYLGTSPNYILIQKGVNNKPFATIDNHTQNIPQFNISHSGKMVMIAFSNSEIGTDVEIIKEMELNSIAEAVFSNEEIQLLKESSTPLITFYQFWTQKEALLKALGLGLIDDTRKINLSAGMDDQFVRKYSKTVFELFSYHPLQNHLATICFEKGKDLKFYFVTQDLFC